MSETGVCSLKYRRLSPKKARQVAVHIKGLPVPDARDFLKLLPKRSALHFSKALSAAVSSYRDKNPDQPVEEVDLVVSRAVADQGPTWRVMKPGVKPIRFGGYSTFKRRTSHIRVEVSVIDEELNGSKG